MVSLISSFLWYVIKIGQVFVTLSILYPPIFKGGSSFAQLSNFATSRREYFWPIVNISGYSKDFNNPAWIMSSTAFLNSPRFISWANSSCKIYLESVQINSRSVPNFLISWAFKKVNFRTDSTEEIVSTSSLKRESKYFFDMLPSLNKWLKRINSCFRLPFSTSKVKKFNHVISFLDNTILFLENLFKTSM